MASVSGFGNADTAQVDPCGFSSSLTSVQTLTKLGQMLSFTLVRGELGSSILTQDSPDIIFQLLVKKTRPVTTIAEAVCLRGDIFNSDTLSGRQALRRQASPTSQLSSAVNIRRKSFETCVADQPNMTKDIAMRRLHESDWGSLSVFPDVTYLTTLASSNRERRVH
jgi:hypothetical protein